MDNKKFNKEEKKAELTKYRDLVLVAIDYLLEAKAEYIKTEDYDPTEHFKVLKIQTEEHFQKGRLTRLKQWFRDLTRMQLETVDLKFNIYLKENTMHDVDIFKSYFQRIDMVIEKGKISSDNQFYDINLMVDHLCQAVPVDIEKIAILNKLLTEYENRKSTKMKKPNA